ncbi:putative cytochrome P450 12a4, mitochondrial [Armadillidium vulgare]|nr:putative cytochrome P450 12a4, mitochondrial [Armadillidium vulgare]
MVDLFIAGLDATSNSLGFTLYLLARNKDKQKKLQEELDIILGDRKEAMTEAQLSKLSYLKACIKESQRLVVHCKDKILWINKGKSGNV